MPRLKTCKACGERYEKQPSDRPFQNWCSTECAIVLARKNQEKARKRAEAKAKRKKLEQKRKDAAWLKANRKIGDFVKDAQREFNRFIRLRDAGDPCISCGRTVAEVETGDVWRPGGYWDCGHFLSVGSSPELRFNEDNAHKQCKTCNLGSGKYGHNNRKRETVSEKYRVRLIAKIGHKRVEWLEGPHDMPQLRREDLMEIQAKYRQKANTLQRQQEAA